MVKILLITIIILGSYIFYLDNKVTTTQHQVVDNNNTTIVEVVKTKLKFIKEVDETKHNTDNGTHTSTF